jgi:PRC-barrel domain protein
MSDIWTYRRGGGAEVSVVGYHVEARDGSIGKIDEASEEAAASYIVVDTGPWIFGKKVLLPAGVIERIDPENERVYVDRTKDEIKSAPEFDPSRDRDEAYREQFGSYYGGPRSTMPPG